METQDKIDTVDETDDGPSAPLEQPVNEKRKIAHWHSADKRASQRGPISDFNVEVGRPKREACYESEYHVKSPGGFKINEKLYRGRVVVPECVANYLTMMDTEWEKVERNLFRNTPTSLHVANL